MEKKVIRIFDTTLRDGEQSPGATLSHKEKILIAQQLERLNVDIIEAGFPVASKDDFKAVNEIAKILKKSIVCALARCKKEDIDVAAKALEPAKKKRIHVFLATSPIHMKYKLKMDESQVLEEAEKWVKYAKQFAEDIEFSPEDAGRSNPEFLYKVLSVAIKAGATTLNIPDTVGYTEPAEYGKLIKGIIENTPGYHKGIIISTHCHDDLGLSVANSLAAIDAGATQVEGTINGIGERAGNTALEEVIMNLHSRENYFNATTNINLSEIYNTSRMVSSFTSLVVQPNKAIVGRNAFAHEAGIHQHGILANREVYEIMNPKTIGKETELVIGKHSGKAAINDFLKKNGYDLNEPDVAEVTERVKALADKKKIIFDEDVIAIANSITNSLEPETVFVKLEEIIINTGNKMKPTATVKLSYLSHEKTAVASGVGPVDAMAKAISSALGEKFELKEYNLKAITGGTDALADVTIVVSNKGGKIFSAESLNEDITMASAEALIKGINKAIAFEKNEKGDESK
ncbi:MAG: 2-isopropylmalate synthase [Candidatus Diapherotrites archaeon CG11_big_fil_rev_8_21_14_0_20_37_9]|nr:MAG: 2-isopropylmalate synthase [Candidatus Diapherotrites archaeon CG11_big_fil_rev_8_21_14_0_20_37_9]